MHVGISNAIITFANALMHKTPTCRHAEYTWLKKYFCFIYILHHICLILVVWIQLVWRFYDRKICDILLTKNGVKSNWLRLNRKKKMYKWKDRDGKYWCRFALNFIWEHIHRGIWFCSSFIKRIWVEIQWIRIDKAFLYIEHTFPYPNCLPFNEFECFCWIFIFYINIFDWF